MQESQARELMDQARVLRDPMDFAPAVEVVHRLGICGMTELECEFCPVPIEDMTDSPDETSLVE